MEQRRNQRLRFDFHYENYFDENECFSLKYRKCRGNKEKLFNNGKVKKRGKIYLSSLYFEKNYEK
jgi:hypothetical protein